MHKKLYLVLLIGTLCVCMNTRVAADDMNEEVFISNSHSFGLESFSAIKVEIAELLKENQQLQTQYNALQRVYLGLQTTADEDKESIIALSDEYDSSKLTQEEKLRELKEVSKGRSTIEQEIMITKSKNSYMSGALMDSYEQQRMKELQLAEAQYHHRELLMDLKLQEFLFEESKGKQSEEINKLKNTLKQILSREQELDQSVKKMQDEIDTYPFKIGRLRKEIGELENQKEKLRIKAGFQARENTTLKDKTLLISKAGENSLFDKKRHKAELEDIVSEMEAKYGLLDDKMNISLTKQSIKKGIVEDIINIDKENQNLRQKITDVKDKIASLK